MFSMFFFPLFPEDWRQAVSDESSVGRKSNPIAVQSSWLFLLVRIYFFLYSKVLALSLEIKQAYDCIMLFKVGKTGMVCWPQMLLYAACVASVLNRVIARKLEREQKDKKGEREGRRGNACLQTPRFWKTPLDILRFGSFVNWQLVKIQWNLY